MADAIFEFKTPEGDILEWQAPEDTPHEQVHRHFYQTILQRPELSPTIARQQGVGYRPPENPGVLSSVRQGLQRGVQNLNPLPLLQQFGTSSVSSDPQQVMANVEAFKQSLEHPLRMTAESTPIVGPAAVQTAEAIRQDPVAGITEAGTTAAGAYALGRVPAKVVESAPALASTGARLRRFAEKPAPSPKIPVTTHGLVAETGKALIRPGARAAANVLERTATAIDPYADIYTNPAYQNRPPTAPVQGPPHFWEQEQPLNIPRPQPGRVPQAQDVMNRPPTTPVEGPPHFWETQEKLNIPRPQPPTRIEAPAAAPVDPVTAIERAIAPSGAKSKVNTLRLAPKLAEVAPEVVGKAPGPEFDKALVDAFGRTSQQVAAAQDAIPAGSVTVSKEPIVTHFLEMANDYQERGLTKTEAVLRKLAEKWDKLPDQIPWEQFRDLKRSFFEEGGLGSGPMRRAYGRLMESESLVSPELRDANSAYSTVRRALEAANIDLKTGRRIAQVGKTVKATATTPRPATAVPVNVLQSLEQTYTPK